MWGKLVQVECYIEFRGSGGGGGGVGGGGGGDSGGGGVGGLASGLMGGIKSLGTKTSWPLNFFSLCFFPTVSISVSLPPARTTRQGLNI